MSKRKWGVRTPLFFYEEESDDGRRTMFSEDGRQPLYDELVEAVQTLSTRIRAGDERNTADELCRLAQAFGGAGDEVRASRIASELEDLASGPQQHSLRRRELFRETDTLANKIFDDVLNKLSTHRKRSSREAPGAPKHGLSRATTSLPPDAMVHLSEASFGFPRRTILKDVNLSIRNGEIVAFIGQNGQGKSTLLRGLAGVLAPSSGLISYPMLEPQYPHHNALMEQIMLVQQSPSSWPGTVETNLRAYAALRGVSRAAITDQVGFFIDWLELNDYRNHRYAELSAGYRTRFELAKAMIVERRLLLLDEPLAPLDSRGRTTYLDRLRRLRQTVRDDDVRAPGKKRFRGMAFAITAVDSSHVRSIADRLFLVEGGTVRQAPVSGGHDCAYELMVADTVTDVAQVVAQFPGMHVDTDAAPNLVHASTGVPLAEAVRSLEAAGLVINSVRACGDLDAWGY